MSSDDVDDSRIVDDVYVPSEITSVVFDTLVDSSTLILDEVHASSEGTSDVVDVLVEFSIPYLIVSMFMRMTLVCISGV